MHKKKININDYASQIAQALPSGILLTTKAGETVNSMVIGWGALGFNWGRQVFTVYVRESRFTRELLDKNHEFTVNVPLCAPDKDITAICGRKSGRDTDKIKEAKLTLVPSEILSVPAIKEYPLTIECKVMYVQKQDLTALDTDINRRFYPQNADGIQDAHITYIGEIVDAYIIED